MTDIDYCDINYCYKKQVPMTASFLRVDQRQTGNKLLRAWQILIIVTATSHFFIPLEEECYMLKKGKSVCFDASKLKTENKTPHLNHMDKVWYLFLSEKKEKKKKEKYISKN